MASDILSNSFLKLNRNQAEILFEIIQTGSNLAKGIQRLDPDLTPAALAQDGKRMSHLILRLGDSIV